MSEYDDHAPVFSGSGTDLVAELGLELTTPLFRQLPPGLITSTKNLWKSNVPSITNDNDILPTFRDMGSNGSTPSSHSSFVKASRTGLHDPPSVNISLSSSSSKRSVGHTFYKTDLDNVFELPQVDGANVFKDDFVTTISLSTDQNQPGLHNIHGITRPTEQEQQVGTGFGSDSNPLLDNSQNTAHYSNLNHENISTIDSRFGLSSQAKVLAEENNIYHDQEQEQSNISEDCHENTANQLTQQGKSGSNSNNKREYLIIPQKTREQLIHMVCIDGMNVQSAVKQLNLKYSAAINIVRKFRDCGQLEIGPRGRRSKKVVSPEMYSAISAILAEHPKIEVGELRQMLKAKGINLPPSLIKDAATNILRQRDAESY